MKKENHWPTRLISLLLSLLLVLFAAVQLNDPDPGVWMALYGLCAVYSGFAFFREYNLIALLLGALLYFGVMLYIFPPSIESWLSAEEQAQSVEMTMPFIEEGREAMGMLICLLVMLYHIWSYYRLPKSEG